MTSKSVRWSVFGAAVLLVAAAWSFAVLGFTFPLSGSMPFGVYRQASRAPGRGEIVLFCLPESVAKQALSRGYLASGSCPSKTEFLAKPVVAVAGDRVFVSKQTIAVNGVRVPGSARLALDFAGRPLHAIRTGEFAVGEGELWVISSYHPRSFDSRYYGPIDVASVVSVLDPVLVFRGGAP